MPTETCCRGHKWIMVLAIVCLTAIVLVAIVRDRIVTQNNWTVQVTGTGEVNYEPDTASVSLGVSIMNEKNASKAIADMSVITKKVIEAVTKLGIATENFQTTNFNLNPHYVYQDNNNPTVTGYDAEQTLLIKIESIDQNKELLGKVIEAASLVGANKVQGIDFTYSKIEEVKQAARILALTDARTKASSTAQAAGVKLSKVVGWWENMVYPEALGKGGFGGSDVAATITVPSGQQKMKIEMNVSYLIKPGYFKSFDRERGDNK
ncbi:MAG: Protein of hypothetical function DUF541 [Parcubacteria group bacterium GW2011_GWC2_39_14]|nr:MAG: Protein of hypothetical function DUF541 [Parcubacteria group bacterium GW2011_GWC2_39_14]KKR55289.1 MAG: Protein of hypothetical function DUF541 [Parcubacteria group bacterium GW2011_GWA2_40_23]